MDHEMCQLAYILSSKLISEVWQLAQLDNNSERVKTPASTDLAYLKPSLLISKYCM